MYCRGFEYLVQKALENAIINRRCNCIALSGGIDTTLIAFLAKKHGIDLTGYSVYFIDGIPRDLIYINYVSKILNIPVKYIPMSLDYIKSILSDVYRCISGNTYHELCIELRNDVVFYTVLRNALEDGCRCIYTGSGGDELFAGYSFMVWLLERDLESYVEKYSLYGRYPELIIGRCIGIDVVAPYLSKEVIETVLNIPGKCLRGDSMEGKKILRDILKSVGLDKVAERMKTPAEAGAGTDSICITP